MHTAVTFYCAAYEIQHKLEITIFCEFLYVSIVYMCA